MPLQNTQHQYGAVARFLHWVTFLLLIAGFGLGLTMVEAEISPRTLKWFSYHKWIGVTVFALAIARLGWRLVSPPPPLLSMPAWQRSAAHTVHWGIYALLIAIPISGWIMSSALGFSTVYLGLWKLPDLVAKNKEFGEQLKTVHYFLNKTLLLLFVLHVAGALQHHFLVRDATLKRMLPFSKVTEV